MPQPKVIETLEHHLLVAMPSITEELFRYSVLYVYEHDASGAMGFVINKPIPISMADILRQLSVEDINIKTHEQFLNTPIQQTNSRRMIDVMRSGRNIFQQHEMVNNLVIVQNQSFHKHARI